MQRFVRVHCKSETNDPFIFDVAINGGKIVPRAAFLGYWGKLNASDLMPFVMSPSRGEAWAKFDFGHFADDEVRFGRSNIVSKNIEVGEQFSYIDTMDEAYEADEEDLYVISSVTDLLQIL
jgi:hypothetical protein